MLSFQNLTLKIQTILEHMLPNPEPKNTMTHDICSSVLKTFNFTISYFISFTNVYSYMISKFSPSKYFK